MKKLINDPKNVVAEAVAGIAAAHGDLVTVYEDPIYIVRKDAPVSGKVGLPKRWWMSAACRTSLTLP